MKLYFSNPGLICCAGKNSDEFFDSICLGNQFGIKKVKCGEKEFFVGKIDDENLQKTSDEFDMRVLQILDSGLNQIELAVKKAIKKFGTKKIGVCLGSCDNGSELSFEAHKNFFTQNEFSKNYKLKVQSADYVATFASKKFGLEGISLAFSTACSSSASAIVKASELIECGICDAVICGGVDVVSNTVLLGFDSLEAVSSEIANPMSRNRKGITLGEGAAVFVLSKEDLDETGICLLGSGESSDAFHITAPASDGNGAIQAMESALKNAKISPSKIDYVNLHATGTKLNDSMEAKAMDAVFKDAFVKCSGIKSITGHTLGASGAIELAACFLSIKNHKLPILLNDGVQDDELPKLNFVRNSEKENVKICMSNSFAFGGCNVSLIIGRDSEKNQKKTIEGSELENLLPQKSKMKLIDKIIDYDTENWTCESETVVKKSCIFFDEKERGVPNYVLFEFAAQTVASLLGIFSKEENSEFTKGFILSVSNFDFEFDFVKESSKVGIKISRESDVGNVFSISCEIFIDEEKMGTGKLTVMQSEE